ncbi:MAG: hypothetical protein WC848_03815 [Parcubacteria group bacterium]|jgi:hypothetical protein
MKKETQKKVLELCFFSFLLLGGLSFSFSASAATQIYRSVGPANTTNLNTTHETVTISGTTATFSDAMPNNVGVGDVLQYDISGTVYLAFITGRTSSSVFSVQSSTGGAPHSASATQVVSVYRAYTSLVDAEAGIESLAFDSTVANFDDWTAGGDATANDLGNDLVAGDLQWNIACYGDAEDDVSAGVVMVGGWTTDDTRFIKIFTPNLTTQVGTSQRHAGVWGETGKYTLAVHSVDGDNQSDPPINIGGPNVWLDGLQILDDNMGTGNTIGVSLANISGLTRISNCIIKAPAEGWTSYGIMATGTETGTYKVWNNIISGFSEGGIYLIGESNTLYAYNNTVYGAFATLGGEDVCFQVDLGTIVAKNNIAQNCGIGYGGTGSFDLASEYNISDLDDTPGSHNIDSQTLTFTDLTTDAEDFHLDDTDTAAIDAGSNLASDAHLSFSVDIDGDTRTVPWDIGADESPFSTELGDEIAPAGPSGLAVN